MRTSNLRSLPETAHAAALHKSYSPWPCYSDEEVRAAAGVIESNRVNYWTGSEGRAFEREFACWAGSRHAVALANGTVALDLALRALGIGQGDEVIVTPRTFIASASCVVNAGASPVFADVDADSGNITAASIEPLITNRTRAILAVHLAGWPCDMPAILALSKACGIKVIEDCAQAHGAAINGKSVGTFGEIGAWSFCQDKIMTTGGEGGMVTTDDGDLWSRMWSDKDHGKSWDAVYDSDPQAGFRWLHESFGTNARMLEVQAAIGRIQLGRTAAWTRRRREIARGLMSALEHFPDAVRAPIPPQGFDHAFYRVYAYVEPRGLKAAWDRNKIIARLNALGVPASHGSCSEVYLERAFEGTPWRPAKRLPVARELGETSIAFLAHPTLTETEVERMTQSIYDTFAEAAA